MHVRQGQLRKAVAARRLFSATTSGVWSVVWKLLPALISSLTTAGRALRGLLPKR